MINQFVVFNLLIVMHLQSNIKEQILSKLSTVSGEYAVAFKDLQSNQTLYINENKEFHAASTMKTAIMYEIFNLIARKKIQPSESLVLKNEFKSIVDQSLFTLNPADDSELTLYNKLNQKISIRELIIKMITESSNLATNILIEKAKPLSIQNTLHKMGIEKIKVLRGVEDQKAYDKGINNTVTAHDLLSLFENIALNKYLEKKYCDEMVDILLAQKFNEIIPRYLPENVKVAHKTGSIKGVEHDAGIVFLPDGRKYVIVLLSKNLKDSEAGQKVLAEVSSIIYKNFYGNN